jgi:hypothetical protein
MYSGNPAQEISKSAWWQILLDVLGLALPGEEAEAGLSIEPGG